MIEQLLSRRKFNRFCAAAGSSLPATSAIAALSSALETSETIGAGSNGPTRAVRLRDGAIVPALGLGSARLAQGRHPEAIEEEALRTGLSLGMTLIDTAEVYSNGHSEELIGRVVAGQRDNVFLVSRVWPSHVAGNGIARACEQASPASAPIISISTCCTGQMGSSMISPELWLGLKVYVRLGKFAPGASLWR
jgi:hypothetical protein